MSLVLCCLGKTLNLYTGLPKTKNLTDITVDLPQGELTVEKLLDGAWKSYVTFLKKNKKKNDLKELRKNFFIDKEIVPQDYSLYLALNPNKPGGNEYRMVLYTTPKVDQKVKEIGLHIAPISMLDNLKNKSQEELKKNRYLAKTKYCLKKLLEERSPSLEEEESSSEPYEDGNKLNLSGENFTTNKILERLSLVVGLGFIGGIGGYTYTTNKNNKKLKAFNSKKKASLTSLHKGDSQREKKQPKLNKPNDF